MNEPSRRVQSNQTGVHPDLDRRVARHRRADLRRPIAAHTRTAFAEVTEVLAREPRPLVLDAGCGTGDSTARLARRHPEAWVIGVDRSEHRLARGRTRPAPPNAVPVRADLVDFWRLAADAGWRLATHYLLYPNPSPKPGHLGRRWHAHPVFPALLELGGRLELRTNWQPYVLEFRRALALHGRPATVEAFTAAPDGEALSPFERKYLASGQTLWRLTAPAPTRPGQAGGR